MQEEAVYEDIVRAHNLITLTERRRVLDMGMLHDVIRGDLVCRELVKLVSSHTSSRRTRLTHLLHVPHYYTNYGKTSVPCSRLPKFYNKKF